MVHNGPYCATAVAVRKSPVIVPAALTEPCTVRADREGGHENDVHLGRHVDAGGRQGLPDPEGPRVSPSGPV